MCRTGQHKTLCRVLVLVAAILSAARFFFGKTPPKHAAEPRACPCPIRPRVPLGLGFGLGSGWSGPMCKIEMDHSRPEQSFVPTSPDRDGEGEPESTSIYT